MSIPLTEEEILKIATDMNNGDFDLDDITAYDWQVFIELVRTIEKHHGVGLDKDKS